VAAVAVAAVTLAAAVTLVGVAEVAEEEVRVIEMLLFSCLVERTYNEVVNEVASGLLTGTREVVGPKSSRSQVKSIDRCMAFEQVVSLSCRLSANAKKFCMFTRLYTGFMSCGLSKLR
jgi:uncharacterized protein (UPF0297 family)